MATSILLVEDSRTQAEQVRYLLEAEGFDVRVATSGEAALATLQERRADLVLSDVNMPGMDGYVLCRRLKTDFRREIPVILLTSLNDPMDIVRGLEAGADNYVTKPYESAHLLSRIRNVLDNRALRSGSESRIGVTVTFLGSTFTINSDREQILDLLISTFEDAVLQNRQLRQREEELQTAKLQLAQYAGTLEARLQTVLETVPQVLFSMNAAGDELYYVSPACAQVLNMTPDELAADPKRLQKMIHPDDRSQATAQYDALVQGGRTGAIEYRIVRGDHSSRWIQCTITPVLGLDEALVRVNGVMSDITDRKQLEEQVRLAQKLEAVGTLAGGVAHDFNNILAAIRASIDLCMLDLEAGSPMRGEMQQIGEIVDRGAILTRQLLAFSRRQALDAEAIDLTALVERTRRMLDRIIGADVLLTMHPSVEPCTVLGDAGQLEQVIMNLCVNARDAMPAGGDLSLRTQRVSLDHDFVALHPWARRGEFVCLTVADSGVGMDWETQARIFEPFFTTKEPGAGTGLGLAVVHGIVKQHGGIVHVYSEPERGTTFRIYLPFVDEAATAAKAPQPQALERGSETLLLAEDDQVLRKFTTKLLERLGYTVLPAATGREALDIIADRGHEIEMAILDVVMPEVNGQAVFERTRTAFPNLRFLFTTGYSPNAFNVAALQEHGVEVLHKPYGFNELAHAVRRTLALAGRT
jgi:PAS domain S-box-containing protein